LRCSGRRNLARLAKLLVIGLVLCAIGSPLATTATGFIPTAEPDLLRSESFQESLVQDSSGHWLYPCGACEAGWAEEELEWGPEDSGEPASDKAPPTGFVSLLIDTDKLTLTVFSDEEVWHRFSVAAGKAETPTALGEWRIANKGIWGGAFGSRWLGLSIPWATYGIHGTNRPGSIGSRASHGCVRMRNRDVIVLYGWVKVGTPVKVVGRPQAHFGEVPRTMRNSYIGSDVIRLQQVLREKGLYTGPIDGRFGGGTERALREFQWASFLPVTGVADQATRTALGLP
jgi:hypothetical protein